MASPGAREQKKLYLSSNELAPENTLLSEQIAKSVVRNCLHIGDGDMVLITTWQHTIDLASSIALECHKVGAKAFMNLNTDTVFYGSMLKEPLESLKKPNKMAMGLWNSVTASIDISGPEDPLKMRKVPPERWAALAQGEKPFTDKVLAHQKRSAYLLLGYVTPQRAKTYGFNFKRWQTSMIAATAVSYPALTKLARKVKTKLEKAKEAHIVSPKTKLSIQLEQRAVYVYDGVVDKDDMKMGSYDAALPAGSVTVAPAETSANGIVGFDLPIPQVGVLIQGLSWSFKNGKLTTFTATKNVKPTKDWWAKARGNKDRIGSLSFGINPQARYGFLNNAIAQGAVSIGIGDNRFIGGKNNSDYGFEGTLSKATVKLDKKPFIRRGKFVL